MNMYKFKIKLMLIWNILSALIISVIEMKLTLWCS
jgi:hypothetical protein